MDVSEALAREQSWRESPQTRPQPAAAKAVAATLANQVRLLEQQLGNVQRLAVGRQVLILRGNPNRGPETGPGFGRRVPAVIVETADDAHQVRCQLLADDPDAVAAPCRAGEVGLWSISQVVVE